MCRTNDVLTPEQCRLLTIFDVQMAVFQVSVHCHWTAGQCDEYLPVGASGAAGSDDDADDDEDLE